MAIIDYRQVVHRLEGIRMEVPQDLSPPCQRHLIVLLRLGEVASIGLKGGESRVIASYGNRGAESRVIASYGNRGAESRVIASYGNRDKGT